MKLTKKERHCRFTIRGFETARSLHRENRRQPIHLFISVTEAPHRRSLEESLSDLPNSELVKKLREFNDAPLEVPHNDELLDLMLPTICADFELCETSEYDPESPLFAGDFSANLRGRSASIAPA